MKLYIGSDNMLEVNDLTDWAGAAITGATVEVTVYEADRSTPATGQSWPLTLSDDGGGDYSGVLQDTLVLVLSKKYWIKVDIDTGSAQDIRWEKVEAALRPFND